VIAVLLLYCCVLLNADAQNLIIMYFVHSNNAIIIYFAHSNNVCLTQMVRRSRSQGVRMRRSALMLSWETLCSVVN